MASRIHPASRSARSSRSRDRLPVSALAAAAVRRDEPTGADLGDLRPAARTRLPARVVHGEKVADLLLEGGRNALAQHADGIGERRPRRLVESVDLFRSEAGALSEWE